MCFRREIVANKNKNQKSDDMTKNWKIAERNKQNGKNG